MRKNSVFGIIIVLLLVSLVFFVTGVVQESAGVENTNQLLPAAEACKEHPSTCPEPDNCPCLPFCC